jgi:hypothetical protein
MVPSPFLLPFIDHLAVDLITVIVSCSQSIWYPFSRIFCIPRRSWRDTIPRKEVSFPMQEQKQNKNQQNAQNKTQDCQNKKNDQAQNKSNQNQCR